MVRLRSCWAEALSGVGLDPGLVDHLPGLRLGRIDDPGRGLLSRLRLAAEHPLGLESKLCGAGLGVGDDPIRFLRGAGSQIAGRRPGGPQDTRRLLSDRDDQRFLVEHRRTGRPLLGLMPGGFEVIGALVQRSDLRGHAAQKVADFRLVVAPKTRRE